MHKRSVQQALSTAKRVVTVDLARWLEEAGVDRLPLECDGLTRCISMLMQREGIEHRVHTGSLSVAGIGRTPLHWWIALPDGRLCDYRARMWLGASDAVPHGVFAPQLRHDYLVHSVRQAAEVALHPVVFAILAERDLDSFPAVVAP